LLRESFQALPSLYDIAIHIYQKSPKFPGFKETGLKKGKATRTFFWNENGDTGGINSGGHFCFPPSQANIRFVVIIVMANIIVKSQWLKMLLA
jgi:hypothetical protein